VDGCGRKILPSLKEEKDWEGSNKKNGFSFKIAQKSQKNLFGKGVATFMTTGYSFKSRLK